jgi:hypothetical protein
MDERAEYYLVGLRGVLWSVWEGAEVGGVVGEREGGWDGTEREARRSRVRP